MAAGSPVSSFWRLLEDLKLFGLMFESLVIRDLRVHAQVADARLFH